MQTQFFRSICLVFFSYFFILSPLSSYEGEKEVQEAFSEIKDLSSPVLRDWILLETFLQEGDRPYLNLFSKLKIPPPPKGSTNWHKNCRNLKLIGYKNEAPIFEIHHINQHLALKEKDQCIVLYASFNDSYAKNAKSMLVGLSNTGFQGDVILHIGGYPNLQQDGLQLCHIPYAWKVASLMEAKNLGYKKILWIDSHLCPIANVQTLFNMIGFHGYFLLDGKDTLYDLQNTNIVSEEVLQSMQIQLPALIPHVRSNIIGLNVENHKVIEFLEEWMRETKKVVSSLSLAAEEIPLSALAYKHRLSALVPYDQVIIKKTDYNPRNFMHVSSIHFLY